MTASRATATPTGRSQPVRLRPAVVLAVWTLLVWTTRIRNVWTDESLSTAGQVWRTALALVFTALAVATLLAWARSRRSPGGTRWAAGVVRVFAVWTVAAWVVRGLQIATDDHGVAFVAVHTALAVVSIGLAAWADRSVHRTTEGEPSAPSTSTP